MCGASEESNKMVYRNGEPWTENGMSVVVKWRKKREDMMTPCHNNVVFSAFWPCGGLTVFVYQTGEKEEFYFRECLEKRGFMPFLKEKERMK